MNCEGWNELWGAHLKPNEAKVHAMTHRAHRCQPRIVNPQKYRKARVPPSRDRRFIDSVLPHERIGTMPKAINGWSLYLNWPARKLPLVYETTNTLKPLTLEICFFLAAPASGCKQPSCFFGRGFRKLSSLLRKLSFAKTRRFSGAVVQGSIVKVTTLRLHGRVRSCSRRAALG